MKYEITGNWKNGYKNDAVLFFAQSIEKLLNPNTDHVHCVSVLNAYSLLYEYVQTFNLVEKEIIDKKHLDFIADEILEALEQKEEILFACGYEARPTGYGLCRGLQKAGYGCVVMVPTTMSNPDGKKRVKADRIDARAIARILAYKSYSQVHLQERGWRKTAKRAEDRGRLLPS